MILFIRNVHKTRQIHRPGSALGLGSRLGETADGRGSPSLEKTKTLQNWVADECTAS